MIFTFKKTKYPVLFLFILFFWPFISFVDWMIYSWKIINIVAWAGGLMENHVKCWIRALDVSCPSCSAVFSNFFFFYVNFYLWIQNWELTTLSCFLPSDVSLHLTTFSLQYTPPVVACVCIHLACKWSNWEIPVSTDGKHWWEYVDATVTLELLDGKF